MGIFDSFGGITGNYGSTDSSSVDQNSQTSLTDYSGQMSVDPNSQTSLTDYFTGGSSSTTPDYSGQMSVDPASKQPSALDKIVSGLGTQALDSSSGTPSFMQSLGTSIGGALDKTISAGVSAAVPLGVMSSFMGKQKTPAAAADLSTTGQALRNIGTTELSDWQAGKINPAQQAMVNKYKTDQTSAMKQYMVKSGQGLDSSSAIQLQGAIDTAAIAMQSGMLDQMYSQGIQALGMSDNISTSLLNMQLTQDQQNQQLISDFMTSWGLAQGAQKSASPGTTVNVSQSPTGGGRGGGGGGGGGDGWIGEVLGTVGKVLGTTETIGSVLAAF